MIWLSLLKRFWWAIPVAALLAALGMANHNAANLKRQRDNWQSTALQYQASANEWQASFRQAEKMRLDEQQAAVGAVNASEASCDARIAKARSSAVKIERIVSDVPTCKPSQERKLADPASLDAAIRGL